MSYESISIIDCNRLQSSEYLGGNNTSKSLWTNSVGSGIKVSPGDRIKVQNSFISEVGSTDGIEFKDRLLERKNITYTKLTPNLYLDSNDSASFRNERQMGYQRVTAQNITEEVIVRQNKCNILYNYYKTSNGENYFNIPRRYCCSETSGSSWAGIDNDNSGKAYENPAVISLIGASFLPNSTEQMFHCDADYFWYQNGSSVKNASENFLKMRNDNSRFKIFINKETHYGYQTDEGSKPEAFSLLYYNKWSPAYYEYLEYIEKLEIEIPEGFSSEEAVGQTITDKLRTLSQPQINNYISLSGSTITQIQENLMKELPMSLELNTNTYKTFWANGIRLSNIDIWTKWNACVLDNNSSTNPRNDDKTGKANNYLSGFQYIGVKRPELFLRSREFCQSYGYNHGNLNNAEILLTKDLVQGNFLNYNDFTEDGIYHIIKTQMLWSDIDKQKKLSEIFKEQGNHPELFTNRYNQYFGFTNVNNSRFLHINALCNASRSNASSGGIPENIIGWDYMTTGANASLDITNFQLQNLNSTPLFIDYNPKYENIQTSGDSWDSGYRYGYLKRYVATSDDGLLTGTEYCAFTTAHFGIGNNNVDVAINYTSIPRPYFGLKTTRYTASIHIEDFSTALGSAGTILSGFNDNLFLNGVLGSAIPAQFGGGATTIASGTGFGSTGGFNSLAVPQSTNKYIKFTGTNPRFLTTKNIGDILTTGQQIQIYYIQGNSGNGGENPDNGEDLEMIIYDITLAAISTIKISLGSDTYVGSTFSLFTHDITPAEQAGGVYIGILQTASSGGNFDNYGVKYLSVAFGDDNIIDKDTGLGIDVHFNAYGNQVIGLLDGYLDNNFDGTSFNTMNTALYNATLPYAAGSSIPNYEYVNKIYLGANNPAVSFNNISGRFEISNLHTSERVQNKFNAGGVKYSSTSSETGAGTPVQEAPTAGLPVYKVNKRLFDNNFTPTMMPYSVNNCSVRLMRTQPVSGRVGFIETYNLNPNMEAWTIFDQLTGIIIKDFGYSSSTWNEGIWGILGFTYEAFNSSRNSTNDLTTRIGTGNKENLPYAITNADVTSTQVLDFATNVWGAGKYTLQMPITQQFNAVVMELGTEPHDWLVRSHLLESFPAITESASSVKLVAKNLPKRIKNGYYVIRSDVLDSANYSGGESGQLYPVMEIVDKSNNNNDFFVSQESSLEFTFTKSTTITNIKTSIHNPDQSPATVDDSSSVIYKLIRTLPDNFDIVNEILKDEKK